MDRPGKDVLVISARPETGAILGEMLTGSAWNVRPVDTNREGIELLSARHVPVVISECGAAEGDWQRLLEHMQTLPRAPQLIVTAQETNDRLWAEVLNLGGYDVLAQPFDKTEVTRVLAAAARVI
jgi:DNA-binding NtrC family response regulator